MIDAAASPVARFWRSLDGGQVECVLCPRHCRLRQGRSGICHVRQNVAGQLRQTAYGAPTGFVVDPIEKKPLYHFWPGSLTYSFGTVGCNLTCRFCQNWEISTAVASDRLNVLAEPAEIAAAAVQAGCQSVAYTYNDPTVFAEYAIDVAAACRESGLRNVAVSAGYIEPEPRAEMYANMDAANIDLKGFSDVFYRRFTGGRLAPVLDTLGYLVHQTNCWVEITTLLISGLNDSTNELEALTNWIVENLGVDIPLHFTAFHPAHRLANHPPTLLADLDRARKIAHDQGLRYVYSGNVPDLDGSTTHCGSCGISLVERQGFTVTSNLIKADGLCPMCRQMVPGQWCDQPAAHDA